MVVGDRVVASMRRRARGREFRSNYHLNGTVEKVDLPPEFEEQACRAARVLGLHVAGVDLLEADHGPLVLEVNSSPGLEGIEKASGVNVAGEIVDYVASQTAFSEVDLDQLLRTVPGSGVLSLQLRNHPNLVGQKISHIFNKGSDIPVFALSRENKLIWNPTDDLLLRYDDVIVCYGDLNELRASIKNAIIGVSKTDFELNEKEESNA